MGTVQIITIIAALLFFFQVIYNTSKNKLQDQQAFIWLIFAISGLILAFFINSLNSLANYLGIAYMPSLIFLVAFLVILNLLLYHTITLSKNQEKIKILTQEISYLKKEISDLSNKIKEGNKK